MKKWNQVWEGFISLPFPRRCPVCDRPVAPFYALICKKCEKKVKYLHAPFCMKCGKQLMDKEQEYCLDCRKTRHIYDRGMSLFDYQSMSDSIYRFKYRGRREYANYYGEQIAQILGYEIITLKPQALVPVPVHYTRKIKRGYNQAELLARAIGNRLNIPVKSHMIKRVKKTLPQKDLNPIERQNNLKKAFKIYRNDVKLNTIVIIDDIYTTGSTVDAIAYELRKAGVEHIYVLTLASGKGY